ncbi:MAG: YbaB/EbfC family nucleoid-associated protein [bacterium]|nr:YbaB/EbfC family nucleoid-associated protein [bacterium]
MDGLKNIFSHIMKLQDKAKEMQSKLEKKTVEASAGGDMVTVKMNGKKQIISFKINKEAVDPDDVEMLEDLLLAACNQAYKKVTDLVTEEVGKLTGGVNIPGMPDISNML